MRWGKDVERLARAFVKQRLDPEYICHYLMEYFQLDRATCDQLMDKVGGVRAASSDNKKGPLKPDDKGKVKRQSFF